MPQTCNTIILGVNNYYYCVGLPIFAGIPEMIYISLENPPKQLIL